MRWPREYIELILRFAATASQLEGIPVREALLHWTPLYLNFGLRREFQSDDPAWQAFLAGYEAAPDPVAWTHSFYLARARQYPETSYGCFAYHYEPDTRTIRFHFGNRDTSGAGPLSRSRLDARLQELTAMFEDIRRTVPEAERVRGRSWMYNLPAYRRLFPPEYGRTAVPAEPELQFMSLWGQFLDHSWQLNNGYARAFTHSMAAAATPQELVSSFPLPVLAPACDISHFYEFYGVPERR
jgi:hypothetical protein